MKTAVARLTWHDVVRQEMGRWVPDDHCGYILWNETAFPFADVEHVRKQVREYRDEGPHGW